MPFEKGHKKGNRFSKENQPDPERLRGKRGKRVSTILKEMLSTDSGEEGLTYAELLAKKMLLSAIGKNPDIDLQSAKEVMDRTEGKTPQTMIQKDGDALDNMSKDELTQLLETLKNLDSNTKSDK